jgi:hypothetical protein
LEFRLRQRFARFAGGPGETEKEALANAQKEFGKTEAERKRIYLRSQR